MFDIVMTPSMRIVSNKHFCLLTSQYNLLTYQSGSSYKRVYSTRRVNRFIVTMFVIMIFRCVTRVANLQKGQGQKLFIQNFTC